jgi:hypothetical protein
MSILSFLICTIISYSQECVFFIFSPKNPFSLKKKDMFLLYKAIYEVQMHHKRESHVNYSHSSSQSYVAPQKFIFITNLKLWIFNFRGVSKYIRKYLIKPIRLYSLFLRTI